MISFINEVALYEDDGTVNVVIEICPGTSDKNELVEPHFRELKCVRQVQGVYPFYYGSFPKTYAGDKDPLDMILFTDKEHQLLDLVKVDVIGAVRTIDAGEQDDKIICVESDCSLMNLKKHMKQAMKFLRSYKGKNSNMIIDKKLASMAEAEELIKNAHEAWKEHVKPIIVVNNKTNSATVVKSTNTGRRVRVIRR